MLSRARFPPVVNFSVCSVRNTVLAGKTYRYTLKVLDGLLNLNAFQVAYEPKGENIRVHYMLLLNLFKFGTCKIVRLPVCVLLYADCACI